MVTRSVDIDSIVHNYNKSKYTTNSLHTADQLHDFLHQSIAFKSFYG